MTVLYGAGEQRSLGGRGSADSRVLGSDSGDMSVDRADSQAEIQSYLFFRIGSKPGEKHFDFARAQARDVAVADIDQVALGGSGGVY